MFCCKSEEAVAVVEAPKEEEETPAATPAATPEKAAPAEEKAEAPVEETPPAPEATKTEEEAKPEAEAPPAEEVKTPAAPEEEEEEDMAKVKELEAEVAALKKQLESMQLTDSRGGSGYSYEEVEEGKGGAVISGLVCKVNHFAIIVMDSERSKDFYCGVLGAKILHRPNFPAPGYWLWLGNIQLHLIEGKHAGVEASHAKGVATGHVNHLSLEVHDFDAVEQRLKNAKVKFTKNLVPEGDDVIHQLFIPDPDGHYIEICDCNKFDEFVHGEERDEEEAKRLAAHYLEGADLLGTTVAAACAISFVPGLNHGADEDEFETKLGNLHRAFKLISGGEDVIDAKHWHSFLKRMGHEATEEDVKLSLQAADGDGDGTLDFNEFSEMMLHRMKPMNSEEELRKCFSMMDRNGDGTIDKDEMLLMLWGMGQRMDETELARAIAAADKDGDGAIDVEEFLVFVKNQTAEEIKNMEEEKAETVEAS